MKNEHEYGTRTRLLKVLRAVLESPKIYTKKALADLYGVSPDTIKGDFEALRNAGFVIDYDERYRYFFVEDKPFRQLKDLLHFSEEDQFLLMNAIDQIDVSDEKGQKLKRKLASLYDYRRLGHSYLRRPYLGKVDALLQAINEKRKVVLIDYRSSTGNKISNRLVEPFHIDPPADTLQAFDADKKALRHFRISRLKRVKITDTNWSHEGHHNIMRTDPFRIVDNKQVPVHLRLKIGAYNELIERFPLTKSYLLETEEDEVFDFQCMVNHKFLGLTNFILGFHHQLVEVLEPDALLEHLNKQVREMKF